MSSNMRKVDVYCGDVFAGQLVELAKGSYEFTYDDAYLEDNNMPPLSVNLSKSKKVYHSNRIFPVLFFIVFPYMSFSLCLLWT